MEESVGINTSTFLFNLEERYSSNNNKKYQKLPTDNNEISQKTLLNEKTGISEKININTDLTFYSKYGDVFSWIMLLITFGLIRIDLRKE